MKNKEIMVKQHMVLSFAVQLITNEYPKKFWSAKNIIGSIKGDTIIITGDLDILKPEIHERDIWYREEKETYKIILKPLNSFQLTPTVLHC